MATVDEVGYSDRAVPQDAGAPQSKLARSPFTPIANYGFLSNCHTGALVAPDGTVDWLCVPRFDSPSVFGALLDRGAGGFRFAPFGINVPSDRIYEPGTNSLVTSWKTATGWAVVRDALTMGPRRGPDTVTPHTRPPADEDADHALVRTASCIAGTVEIDLVCEPVFDYGRVPGEWTVSADCHRAEVTGRRSGTPAADRHAARHRRRPGPSPPRPAGRRDGLLRAGLERRSACAEHRRRSLWAARGDDDVLARLARARVHSRPRARAADPALGTDDQGTHVHAHGGGRRGAHHLAARDTRRRAQLGLPLHLDPRLDLPAAGPALPAPRLGGRRVHAVHGRRRTATTMEDCRSCTGSTVAGT